MRKTLSLLSLLAASIGSPGFAQGPKLDCSSGPLSRTYGATPWLVYACSDGKSVVVVTDAGSPAAPFYFMLFPKDGDYEVVGEGTGPKQFTDRAYAELIRLTDRDVALLISEAGKIKTSKVKK